MHHRPFEQAEPFDGVSDVVHRLDIPRGFDDAHAQRGEEVGKLQCAWVRDLKSGEHHRDVYLRWLRRIAAEGRGAASRIEQISRGDRRHRDAPDQLQLAIVGRIKFSNRSCRTTSLRPAGAAQLGTGAHTHLPRHMSEVNGIAGLGTVDLVLVLPRGALALIIRGADHIAVIDPPLQARHAVVNLLSGRGVEVGDQIAYRVRLRRRTGGISEAGGAVAPGQQLAILARCCWRDHQAADLVEHAVDVFGDVAHPPGAGSADRNSDVLARQEGAWRFDADQGGKARLGG